MRAEYIKYCSSARKNPKHSDVVYLDHTLFRKLENVIVYKTIRPVRVKGYSKVTDIRTLKYTPEGEIFDKERFSADWSRLPQRKINITNEG